LKSTRQHLLHLGLEQLGFPQRLGQHLQLLPEAVRLLVENACHFRRCLQRDQPQPDVIQGKAQFFQRQNLVKPYQILIRVKPPPEKADEKSLLVTLRHGVYSV